MKQAFPEIVGNDALKRHLADDVMERTLSHAYIFEGPAGIGKHTLALHLSAALACENRDNASMPLPCMQCPACRKVLEGKSPDVTTIGRDGKATIGVETIRALREDVHVLPNDLEYKVYIIEDMHTMTVQAQNAFLLTLEEPPAFVLFLLLCENSRALLETIRSRAPVLPLRPVPTRDMEDYLCRTEPRAAQLRATSAREWQELLLCANGSIGRARTLLDAKARAPLLARRRWADDFVRICLDSRDRAGRAITAIGQAGKTREELNETLLTLETALRDLLALKKEENAPLLFYTDLEDALHLSDSFSATALLRLWDATEETRLAIFVRNANIRLSLVRFVSEAGMLP